MPVFTVFLDEKYFILHLRSYQFLLI